MSDEGQPAAKPAPKPVPAPHRLLRLPEVVQRVGIKRPTIYRRMAEGSFPLAVQLGGHTVAWSSREIDEWIEEQLKRRDEAA